MSITYSQYQNNLFLKIEERTGNLMVNAVAGSGKTFSLVECMRRSVGDSIFVAFNKSIRPPEWTCSLHAARRFGI